LAGLEDYVRETWDMGSHWSWHMHAIQLGPLIQGDEASYERIL
jgi:hypothetical protein